MPAGYAWGNEIMDQYQQASNFKITEDSRPTITGGNNGQSHDHEYVESEEELELFFGADIFSLIQGHGVDQITNNSGDNRIP